MENLEPVSYTHLDVYKRQVVGFMKECYEYLIDEYQVKLIYNGEYASKNNLYSLSKVVNELSNTYIIPCDIWCRDNPFSKHELYSWYMVTDEMSNESDVSVNRKMELIRSHHDDKCNKMIGICYLTKQDGELIKEQLMKMSLLSKYDHSFWEETLYDHNKMIPYAKIISAEDVIEIDTYEDLREIDCDAAQLKNDAISTIAKVFHVEEQEITNIAVLKKGMTNRSFIFQCKEKKYIMRIPGEGTDQLIDRKKEAEVYQVIADKKICDDLVYINPVNGYKITEYFEHTRSCDPFHIEDVKACMMMLKTFHESNLKVKHEFDVFKQIDFYESLWDGIPSIYKDYDRTKQNVLSLKAYIDQQPIVKTLSHIDAVADNFLFIKKNGKEEIRLIDWEYAGMQDPHIDIAMFAIYAMYDKQWVDRLIDVYFDDQCEKATRIKIYCYIAVCGLLWSNWCEYKRNLGVEFGEYSLRQYRYAKEYYRYVTEELGEK